MATKRVSGTRAGRAALERAGRGRNPVMPRKPAARKEPGSRGGQRNGQPPLTVRGVGLLAGGLLLGVGAGVTLERWINCFPCLSFLMCVPPGREEDCQASFGRRGLVAATVGTLDDTGLLRISSAGETETVFDLGAESVTNLARATGR